MKSPFRVTSPSAQQMRLLFFLIGDVVLLTLSMVAAAWLRFDGRLPPEVVRQLPEITVLSVLIKLPIFMLLGMYALSWSQVSLDDMVRTVRGVTVATALLWITVLILRRSGFFAGFSRAILLLDYVLTLHAIGAFRMGRRVYQYLLQNQSAAGRRAIIVGAGAAGEQLLRSLRQTPASAYAPVGFLDDDPLKSGAVIHGLRVLGRQERMAAVIRTYQIEAVLIAIPSAPTRVIRHIVSSARDAGVREIRIIPGLDQLLNGQLSFTDLREVQLTDLLGREVVKIDSAGVGTWLRDRVVLVTGAGGSIGSELCRQIAAFHPRTLVLLDFDESGLFWAEQDLRRPDQDVRAILADVRDAQRMREVMKEYGPDLVFHAAAYKHVGLMERHPEDAVTTNILGTLSVARASVEAGVEKFIFISTDKAVNPTSVMGATKRVGEEVCLTLGRQGPTRFVAVRFGNVLGSRGSVVPIFQDKIRRGDPIVVRGTNMRRYFMATSEAVLLVLQAAVMGHGGEVFVLDMGEPVRIMDLANDLIRLSGLQPGTDVPIIVTEPEPGEKEHEDLLSAEEGTIATRHDRIFIAAEGPGAATKEVFTHVAVLEEAVVRRERTTLVRILQQLVPTYQPSPFVLEGGPLAQSLTGETTPARGTTRA